jgi:Transposase
MIDLACDVRDHPDSYLFELTTRFGVSAQSIAHALRRMNITFKKTLNHPRADAEKWLIF